MFLLLLTSTVALATDTTVLPRPEQSEQTLRMYYEFKMDSLIAVNTPYHAHVGPHDFIPYAGMLIPIVALIVGLILGKRYIEARRLERMAMIERGVDMSIFTNESEATKKFRALRLGMMYAGIGLGLVLGTILVEMVSPLASNHQALLILGSASLFGGLGLLAFYIIVRRLERS